MCGRFACSLCPERLRARLKESDMSSIKETWMDEDKFYPSYNVAPRRWVPVVRQDEQGECILQTMKWGFIPCWAKQIPDNQPINARDDRLMEGQSMFDAAKNKRRCMVVAEGFYEWRVLSGGKKIPYYTKRKDGKLMLFAGLYDVSHLNDEKLYTCTIVTTSPSAEFSFLHDRMPVILENGSEDIETWLDHSEPWGKKQVSIMRPYSGELIIYQVTDKVGPVKNNSAEFVVPVDELKGSISNFLQKKKPEATASPVKKEEPDDEKKHEILTAAKRKRETSPAADEKRDTKPASKDPPPSAKVQKVVKDEKEATDQPKSKITNFFPTKKDT